VTLLSGKYINIVKKICTSYRRCGVIGKLTVNP